MYIQKYFKHSPLRYLMIWLEGRWAAKCRAMGEWEETREGGASGEAGT